MSNETAPVATPAAAVADAGPVTTPAAAIAGEKPKRTRSATGASIFAAASLIAARSLAEDKNKELTDDKASRFAAFKIEFKNPDGTERKPTEHYASNHRNAVQTKALADAGITISAVTGGGGRKPNPLKVKETAETFIAALDPKARAELFAKYATAGAFDAAAGLPAAEKRDDTTPDFEDKPTGATPSMATGEVAAKAPAAAVAPKGARPAPAKSAPVVARK